MLEYWKKFDFATDNILPSISFSNPVFTARGTFGESKESHKKVPILLAKALSFSLSVSQVDTCGSADSLQLRPTLAYIASGNSLPPPQAPEFFSPAQDEKSSISKGVWKFQVTFDLWKLPHYFPLEI